MLPAAQPTCFLIADISGYTGYLADVKLEHAQDILADLIGAVVSALRPNFRLAKLEGDAAFTSRRSSGSTDRVSSTPSSAVTSGFVGRRRDVRQATSCECNACARIPDLDLKFVRHKAEVEQASVDGDADRVQALILAPMLLAARRGQTCRAGQGCSSQGSARVAGQGCFPWATDCDRHRRCAELDADALSVAGLPQAAHHSTPHPVEIG